MQSTLKALIFGVLTWVIPFIISIPFYGKGGVLMVDETTFKTVMIIVGAFVGAYFLYLYFKKVDNHYMREGWIIGVLWFAINIILDLIILVPMAKISISTYFLSIGLRYLIIPFMSLLAAGVLNQQAKQ